MDPKISHSSHFEQQKFPLKNVKPHKVHIFGIVRISFFFGGSFLIWLNFPNLLDEISYLGSTFPIFPLHFLNLAQLSKLSSQKEVRPFLSHTSTFSNFAEYFPNFPDYFFNFLDNFPNFLCYIPNCLNYFCITFLIFQMHLSNFA